MTVNNRSQSISEIESKKMFRLFGRRLDIARTGVHYALCAILGLLLAIPGPTLLDLKQLIGSDSHEVSFLFTVRSIGFLVGSLTGGIVLDCIKYDELALIISSAFIAAGAYIIPWCRNLPTLLGTFTVTGFAMGFCNTGSNASCLRMWGNKGAPFLQGLHFAYGVGGFLAPILAAPFLSFTESNNAQNITDPLSSTLAPLHVLSNATETITLDIVNESTIPTITYAYTIIGIAATLVCGVFTLVHILAVNKKICPVQNAKITTRDPGLAFTIVVVILACLQTGLISGVEISFAQMLTSYVVKSDHQLTKVVGSYMTSVYWGAYTLTRAVSIFLTCKVNVMKLLAFDLVLSVSATLFLLTMGTWSVTALWIGTALLGTGVASIFPATLSWIEKYININNRIASVFTLVSCILEMTVPLTISMYLDTYHNVLFHFIFTATMLCSVLFVILNMILNWKGEKYRPTVEGIGNQEENLQLTSVQ